MPLFSKCLSILRLIAFEQVNCYSQPNNWDKLSLSIIVTLPLQYLHDALSFIILCSMGFPHKISPLLHYSRLIYLNHLPKHHRLHNLLHSLCHYHWSRTNPIQNTLPTTFLDYNKSLYPSLVNIPFYLLEISQFFYSTPLFFASEIDFVLSMVFLK